MSRPPVYTNEKIIAALKETKGLVFLAAKRLGCSPQTIYNRSQRSPDVANVIKNERGEVVDTAELTLYNAILAGEPWAIQLTLKTLGKDRGYVERTEQEHRGSVQLEIVEEIVEAPDNQPGTSELKR
jgi:hypothetical protein